MSSSYLIKSGDVTPSQAGYIRVFIKSSDAATEKEDFQYSSALVNPKCTFSRFREILRVRFVKRTDRSQMEAMNFFATDCSSLGAEKPTSIITPAPSTSVIISEVSKTASQNKINLQFVQPDTTMSELHDKYGFVGDDGRKTILILYRKQAVFG